MITAKQEIGTKEPKVQDETIGGCIYGDNCPLLSDNPPFNAETIAAFEEGDAIMRGEIPAKRYDSLAEMWEDLDKEDPDD